MEHCVIIETSKNYATKQKYRKYSKDYFLKFTLSLAKLFKLHSCNIVIYTLNTDYASWELRKKGNW